MVDYTTSKTTSGSSIGLLIAAGIVVAILLFAIFAGGGGTSNLDPAAVSAPDAAAPAADVAPEAPVIVE